MLNKLSINYLYDAVTVAQCTESTEFAIVGHKETLDVLDKFSKALGMPDSKKRVIWNTPCIESTKVKLGCIVIACQHYNCETKINKEHYSIALKNIVEYNPEFEKKRYGERLTEADIWGLEVRLG